MNKLFCIAGPSGVGKTTILNLLINSKKIDKLIRTTTRQVRPNENNNEYNFISKKQFLLQKQNDNFIHTENYDENFYAIERQIIIDFFNNSTKTGLIISGIHGAIKLKEIYKQQIVIIYIYVAEKHRLFCHDNETEIRILKKRLRDKFVMQYPNFDENKIYELVEQRNELNIKELLFVKNNIFNNNIDFIINATDKIENAISSIKRLIERA